MLTPNHYQQILCNLEQILICNENNFKELLLANNTLKTLPVSTIQQNILSLSITDVADDLFLFNGSLNEINVFIDRLQKYIIKNYGNFNSFINNYNIKFPRRVANLYTQLGYTIDTNNIDYCQYSNGIGSSSSSLAFVDSVIRLSDTNILWNFNFEIAINSVVYNNVIPLTVNNVSPTSIVTYDAKLIILQYPNNNSNNWKLKVPCDLVFLNGKKIFSEEEGLID